MSTITVAKKGSSIAMSADSLSSLGDTLVSSKYDAHPGKIIKAGDTYIGIVGCAAHYLVFNDILHAHLGICDFTSVSGIFQTFQKLHPILKKEYFLSSQEEEDQPYESTQIDALIANQYGIFGVQSYREVYEYQRFWATGSGWRYALGAMYCCYDREQDAKSIAEIGVKAGCEFDNGSELPLETKLLP